MYNFVEYKKRVKPYKFLTFSFDDGITQDRRFVEMLNKYGLKCTFNLNSGVFGNQDILPLSRPVNHFKIDSSEVKNLYKGHEVAVHSLTHPRLDLCSKEEMHHQIFDDKANLERLSGQEIIGMAYPGGPFYNEDVFSTITEAGLLYARDTKDTFKFDLPTNLIVWQPTVHFLNTPELHKCVDDFISLEPKEDCLLYIWGHSYEFDFHDMWDVVDEILLKLSNKDDITYVTNGEIATYIVKGNTIK